MANLSNINNKFLVTTGGNVLIGQTAAVGTSKLQVTGTMTADTVDGTVITDGFITMGFAQINRYGAAIELQYTPTNAATLVKIGANGSNPTIFNAYTGDATFAGTIQTTGANLFYLGKGVYTKATNASNDVDATNIWGYGLYEGAVILGELSTIRDGTVTLNLGTTYTTGKVVIRTDNKVTALTIDASQNATFAGNITISKATPFITLSNTAEDECGIVMLDSADPGQSAKITYDAGSSNSLKFYNNAATERMRIESSGRIKVSGTNYSTASGGVDTGGLILVGDVHGDNNYTAGIGFSMATGTAGISGVQNGTDADRIGLSFFTHGSGAGSAASAEAMRIDSSGNVGIGTTSPRAVGSGYKGLEVSSTSSGSSLWLSGFSDTTKGYLAMDTGGLNLTAISNHSLTFGTNNSPKMTILSGGNVGIGTTSPNAPLDVLSLTSGSSEIQQWSYNTAPSSYRLQLNQIVSSGLVKYSFDQLNAGAGYNNVIVLDRGNVGIGTSSPDVPLDVEGAIQASESGGDFIRMQTDGTNNIFDVNSGAYVFRTSGFSERMRITSAGNVGIVTTTPYSRLDVNGVITNRTASADPNFTVTANGMIVQDSGSLQFTQGFAGTSSAGDTVVFRYNATAWKSWSLDYTFASTDGLVKGTIGGYNNNNGGGTNFFLANQMVLNTPVATNSGQTVIVTFTGNFGIHMMCDMRYSQGGGDGAPRADRASLTYNS